MAEITVNYVSKKLQQWLLEEGDNWKFTIVTDQTLFLSLQLRSTNGRNIHVQLDDIHDRIFIVAKMSPTEAQKRAFLLLASVEKKRFGPNLLILLFQLGLAAAKNPAEAIEDITLQEFLYFDGLTKDRFFNSLYSIWRGLETIQEFYDALPDVPSDNESLK